MELPKYEWPTVSIEIASINGFGGTSFSSMGGANLYRQPEESDEDLAKRAGQAIESQVLNLLKENPKIDPTKFLIKKDVNDLMEDFMKSLDNLDDAEKDAPPDE